jgi:hypothetical protein
VAGMVITVGRAGLASAGRVCGLDVVRVEGREVRQSDIAEVIQ